MENTESNICRYKKNFITNDEVTKIVNWIQGLQHAQNDTNHHLTELSKTLNGKSFIFDISNSSLTNYITKFQSITKVSYEILPDFIYKILDKISEEFDFPKDNVFLQAVDMDKGGKIDPHYDASLDGYINYKCNVSVLSDNYQLFLDKESINIEQTDLYGFEASLYKHWTEEFNSRRIFLSFGFLLKYEQLNRSSNDPRVRLSKRIKKYFQNN